MLRLGLVLLGLFHLGNGLWMIAAPDSWYASVPGVVQTGPMNHHFITDIGLAFAGSGAFMILGWRAGTATAALALAGATFPTLHGLFHVWEWIADGVPADTRIMVSDLVAVMFVSFLGIALAWANARREGVV